MTVADDGPLLVRVQLRDHRRHEEARREAVLGEQAARTARDHLIVRTAWLYGLGGRHFVGAIQRQVDAGDLAPGIGEETEIGPRAAADLEDLSAIAEAGQIDRRLDRTIGAISRTLSDVVTVFDPDTVTDNSTLEPGKNSLPSTGIPYVIVNGQVVVDDSVVQRIDAGVAIRNAITE